MNICIFGDSITWGAFDPISGGWVTRLRNYFEAKNNDIDVYNLGISGDTTTDLLARLEIEAKSREPDLIIFAIGINDAQFIHSTNSLRTSLEQFDQNLNSILETAKSFTNQIMFVGLTTVDESKTSPLPWSTDKTYSNNNILKFDELIKQFCKKNNLEFFPLFEVISASDLHDGLHPNSTGHSKIFNHLLPRIEAIIV